MAFKARLNFSGKKYNVLQYAYALKRDMCGNIFSGTHVNSTIIRFNKNLG